MIELTCPNCRKHFNDLHMDNSAIGCPSCGDVMFYYHLPSEPPLTKDTWLRMLHEERGKAAVKAAQKWIPQKHSLAIAAALVAFLWLKIAEAMEAGINE